MTDSLFPFLPFTQNVRADERPRERSFWERSASSPTITQHVTEANFNGPNASQTIISWGDGKTSVGTIVADGAGVRRRGQPRLCEPDGNTRHHLDHGHATNGGEDNDHE